jgi:uncharacterized protein (DUF433 family)
MLNNIDLNRREGPPCKKLSRITMDPQVMGGKPCIRSMRVTVGTLVGLMASGKTIDGVLAAYPYIERQEHGPGWQVSDKVGWEIPT